MLPISVFTSSLNTAHEQENTECSYDRSNSSPNPTMSASFDFTAIRQKETKKPVNHFFSQGKQMLQFLRPSIFYLVTSETKIN